MNLIDQNGVTCFIDQNSVTCWVDQNANILCCGVEPPVTVLLPQACM